MKKFLFFLLVMLNFIQHLQLNAQNKTIDSLKLALKNAKHDTTRLRLRNNIGEAASIFRIGYWDSLAMDSKKLKNKLIEAATLNNIGYIYNNQGRIIKALEYYQKSLKIFEGIDDKRGIAASLNNMALIYITEGNIPKAMEYYRKSLKIQVEIGNKNGIANSLYGIGTFYKNQGDIPKALEYLHKTLKIYEEIGDKREIAYSFSQIGTIYDDQGDLLKALEYYQKSLKIFEGIDDKRGIAACLNNIGYIYTNLGRNIEALDYWHKSLKIKEEIGDKNGIASSLSNIGTNYQEKGDIPKALEYYQKSLKIYEEIGDKNEIAFGLNNIARLMIQKGEINEALLYAKRSIQLAKEIGYPSKIKNAAITLKQIFQKQNKFKEAFEMYELEIKMRDIINNQETQKAAVKKQMQYTYEKKAALDSTAHAKENDIKNAEILARKAELKVKQNTQYALYGGLALVLIFAGFMFNRFKVTQKQKQIIEIKEKETQLQKHIIEEKHKEITDSINYAERIQRSFIATKEILDENLSSPLGGGVAGGDGGGYFVFFKPKDVVSGDFYWAAKLSSPVGEGAEGGGGLFALVTADSTGHGVPGAIMSLLNITSLEKAIETLTEPSEILNSTRKTIIERLKKDGSEHGGKDGMDASLCVFDFKNKKLIVAAANNPVWIVRKASLSLGEGREGEAQIIEIKPDKMPVGKHDKDQVSFTQQTIDLQSGDVVYTLTDGFPDQFGGEKGKKFMSKNLKELLSANSHLPMPEQKQLLEKTFADWVGDLEQVDDVTLIGVRI